MTSEGRILLWDVEFEQVKHVIHCNFKILVHFPPSLPLLQVGLHGQEFPDDTTPPTLLSACPVEPGLVDLPVEGGGDRQPTDKLTLRDTIAPHWFSPPEGKNGLIFYN